MDNDGVISIEIKLDLWDILTSDSSLKEYSYRGSLSHKYNPGVKKVQLVRDSDKKTIVVWQAN